MTNSVYAGVSLDGCIAGPEGNLDWLDYVPAPEGDDLGFAEFVTRMDAVVMGRITFETVVGFGMGWVYPIPGIVLSSTLAAVPAEFRPHVEIASGTPLEIVDLAAGRGFHDLYVDGGTTVQSFLREDLIDELILSHIPILVGGGQRLFGDLVEPAGFELIGSEVLLGQIVKSRYRRKR